MRKLQTPLEKSYPLFPSNPPLKFEVLWSARFLKIWLEVQPLPPAERGAGCALCIRSWRAKNTPKTFFQVLERQNMKNQTIFKLYTDYNKSEYSSNPKDILKSAKKIWNTAPSEFPQLLLLNLFAKFLTERKYLMNTLIFVRLKDL